MTKRKFAGQAPPSSVRFRAGSDDRDRGNLPLITTLWSHSSVLSDDFRTALIQANAYLKSLAATSRPGSSTPVMTSLSTSPSPTNSELDKVRIDIMNKLVNVLQRNLRVRYELSVSDLVQASVPFLPASMVCRLTNVQVQYHRFRINPRSTVAQWRTGLSATHWSILPPWKSCTVNPWNGSS